MKIRLRLPIGLCLLTLPSCTPSVSIPAPPDPDRLTQVSVINALMLGGYDGVLPIAELLALGDFGIGTLDHLDGELIVLDGRAYQVRGDGVVAKVGPGRSTPFASVVRFRPDGEVSCPRTESLADLEARLDDTLARKNYFVAVRVDGRFASLTLRSVGRQEPPYRPLGEVARGQSVWSHEDLRGTMIGIRCPAWVGGLNVPGYHWHFLSEDRGIGGHVLDCRPREGRVRFDVCHDWAVKLPESREFEEADLTADLRRDLKRVESSRGPAPIAATEERGSARSSPPRPRQARSGPE